MKKIIFLITMLLIFICLIKCNIDKKFKVVNSMKDIQYIDWLYTKEGIKKLYQNEQLGELYKSIKLTKLELPTSTLDFIVPFEGRKSRQLYYFNKDGSISMIEINIYKNSLKDIEVMKNKIIKCFEVDDINNEFFFAKDKNVTIGFMNKKLTINLTITKTKE